MIHPSDYKKILLDLQNGILNMDLYETYGFNPYVGIKARKNKTTNLVDIIIIVWNREKSIYDNIINLETNVLTYIGAGLEGKQIQGRQNSTLVNYFINDISIPVILCGKFGKNLQYISLLKKITTEFVTPNINNHFFKFNFLMESINYKMMNRLLNIIPNKIIPWEEKSINIVKRKKDSIKRLIGNQELRDLLKELQFIGDLGELLVLSYEYSRLNAIGLKDYAEKIEHSSMVQGHGLGYDIKSYDFIDNTSIVQEIFIEVKTTKLHENNNFTMTENEYNTMTNKKNQYRIYRVYEIYEKQDTINEYKYPFENLKFIKKTKNEFHVKNIY